MTTDPDLTLQKVPAGNSSSSYQVYIDVWHDVAQGINSGAYAVLLAIAVVYALTRRAIGKAWVQHFRMLEMLRRSTTKNSRSLRIMANTQKRLADLYIQQGARPNPNQMLEVIMTPEDSIEDDYE